MVDYHELDSLGVSVDWVLTIKLSLMHNVFPIFPKSLPFGFSFAMSWDKILTWIQIVLAYLLEIKVSFELHTFSIYEANLSQLFSGYND